MPGLKLFGKRATQAVMDTAVEVAKNVAEDAIADFDPENLLKLLGRDNKSKSDIILNVMMVGGKRCGKTSVLASMQSSFEDIALQTTNLMLNTANMTTLNEMEKKRIELSGYFADKGNRKTFETEDDATLEIRTYGFDLSLRGEKKKKGNRLCLNFIDYPGEWLLVSAPAIAKKRLATFMETSHIMIVAIDTPYMMEENGQYGDIANAYYSTTEMIKQSGFLDKESMILFVPLKCERYFNNGKDGNKSTPNMDDVQSKVREAYKTLIQLIQNSEKCVAAITPILTLGGAAFSKFARDDDGDIIMRKIPDTEFVIPDKPIYYFPDNAVTKPEPKFCAQPLLYTLAYALQMAKTAKQKRGGLNVVARWFQTQFLKWPSAEDYETEFAKIRKQMKTSGDGYCILKSNGWLKE